MIIVGKSNVSNIEHTKENLWDFNVECLKVLVEEIESESECRIEENSHDAEVNSLVIKVFGVNEDLVDIEILDVSISLHILY